MHGTHSVNILQGFCYIYVFFNYYYESDLNMFRMTVILNIFSKRTRCIIRDYNISSFY